MRRHFNTEGICNPQKHYMVDLEQRLVRIKRDYVEPGYYFSVNRGRQFGKTTMLRSLAEFLKNEYMVWFVDFQNISTSSFESETQFVKAFVRLLLPEGMSVYTGMVQTPAQLADRQADQLDLLLKPAAELLERERISLDELFVRLSVVCANALKPIVLIIDEVDSASNNQIFLDFLALLRGYYLDRDNKRIFHTVILAGVYDIKNLRLKFRNEEEHRYNSPWNIATEFRVDMGFSADEIARMLWEYELDCRTGMDVNQIADEIYQYTSGYPYLVSAICRRLDERFEERKDFGKEEVWTKSGIAEIVKVFLNEPVSLFESMVRQLVEFPELKEMLHAVLFQGKRVAYNRYHPVIHLASMFGYIVNKDHCIQVSNRVFEILLYHLFLSEEEFTSVISEKAQGNMGQFFFQGRLNMDLVLEKFVVYQSGHFFPILVRKNS